MQSCLVEKKDIDVLKKQTLISSHTENLNIETHFLTNI